LKSVVKVDSEDHTPADKTHARTSDSPHYVAAVLPTADPNHKNLQIKALQYGTDITKQSAVMTTAGRSL
jgi:hypothetical protein